MHGLSSTSRTTLSATLGGKKLSVRDATAQLLGAKRPHENAETEPVRKRLRGKGGAAAKNRRLRGKGGAAAKGKGDQKAKGAQKVKVSYSHESSRKPFQCRCTGGQSVAFSYGHGSSKAQAETDAKKWCRQQCAEHLLPIAAKFRQ